ncbi:MAG: hypothetical protein OEZ52_10850 [Candidatus Aminicenantes bacterium]|nr:hypothetical protein [Candidatus Aminicenantes bacterium]
MLSEILAPFFGCHQQLLLDDLRGRWVLSLKGELERADNPVDNFLLLDKRDDSHLTST